MIDHDGNLLGAITIDDILDVLVSEYSEDLLKYGGIIEALIRKLYNFKSFKTSFKNNSNDYLSISNELYNRVYNSYIYKCY